MAAQAARKTVSLGRNSCHKQPEHYIHLVEALSTQLFSGGIRDRRYVSTEITKTLSAIRNEFPEDPNMIIRSYVLESETEHKLGHERDAARLANEAEAMAKEELDNISSDLIMAVGKNLINVCDIDTGTAFLASEAMSSLSKEQKNELIKTSESVKEARIKETIDELNNRGVEYFERGMLEDAIKLFDKAASYPTASFSVLLNAVQAQVALLQKEFDDTLKIQCESHIKRLESMPKEDRRYPRFEKLTKMLQATGNAS